jgi:hypothetical protein
VVHGVYILYCMVEITVTIRLWQWRQAATLKQSCSIKNVISARDLAGQDKNREMRFLVKTSFFHVLVFFEVLKAFR